MKLSQKGSSGLLDLVILERAEGDLFETIRYGAEVHGMERAQAYVTAISDRIEWLREYPGAGPIHEQLHGQIRSFRQHRHRIYYTVNANRLTVIRILHVSRDVVRYLE
jgi:toxin ParE1/3/4